MGSQFPCPQCGRPLQVGNASPGTRILCAGCGSFSTIPAPQPGEAIEFRCTGCDKLLRTPADTAGKQAKCPQCGAISPVPAVGPPAGPAGPAETTSRTPSPPPPPPPPPPSAPFLPPGPHGGGPLAPEASASVSPVGPAGPVVDGDAENPYQAPTQYCPPPPPGHTDPKAVASLVLGLSGFALFCGCGVFFPLVVLPVALPGLVLGIMARTGESRGLATAGIILCAIQLFLLVASAAVSILFIMMGNW